MVNDDLSGVAVGIDAMRKLLNGPRRRYTYRLLIVPETIGSIAYLSHNEHLIKNMKGGLFLEMLGRSFPHSLQLSLDGGSELDMCCSLAMKESDPSSWTGAFRSIIGNDERQFNGPGVRVPMLSLSRVLRAGHPEAPYREYHSSADTPALVSEVALQQSCDLVLKFVDTVEDNIRPLNTYKGEPFCSRYGLHIDPYMNPEGNRALFRILDLIDGTRSIADIAVRCGISFTAVRDTIRELTKCGLVVVP
jgi:aminopeptidase-like protein